MQVAILLLFNWNVLIYDIDKHIEFVCCYFLDRQRKHRTMKVEVTRKPTASLSLVLTSSLLIRKSFCIIVRIRIMDGCSLARKMACVFTWVTNILTLSFRWFHIRQAMGTPSLWTARTRKEGTRSRYTQDLLRSSRAISIAQLSGELVNICHECRA